MSGTVCRTVASNHRGLWFKSIHHVHEFLDFNRRYESKKIDTAGNKLCKFCIEFYSSVVNYDCKALVRFYEIIRDN